MKFNRNHNHSGILRKVANVLIVAAAVVFVGVFLVFQCLSFDENGAHVIDRYGVLAMEARQTQDTGSAQPPAEEPQEESPAEEEPAPAEPSFRAAMLAVDELTDENEVAKLIQLAQAGTLNTVIVNIKDSEGYLNIHVSTNEIDDPDYITEDSADAVEDGIKALSEAGVHVIGRIYCMHDKTAAARNSDLAMQFESGGTWHDFDDNRWLDITNHDAVGYIGDVAKSAVKAGCAEILLEEFILPERGHLDRIDFADYPKDQASTVLAALKRVQKDVGDVPVSVSASSISALKYLSNSANEDGFETGDVSALLQAYGRIYVPADSAEEAAEAVQEIKAMAPDAVVIPVLDSISEWMEYQGDAILRAVYDSYHAVAVMNGEESADEPSYDDEDDYDYDYDDEDDYDYDYDDEDDYDSYDEEYEDDED